jgi:hypothetical protein
MSEAREDDTGAVLDAARCILNEPGADADVLYRRWFHRETGHSIEWPSAAQYLAATRDATRFEKGWRVLEAAPGIKGGVVALRGGRERIVGPPEMTPDDARSLSLRRGALVRVDPLVTAEKDGFWHVWSAGWQKASPKCLQRLYLSVERRCALDLMARITAAAPARAVWYVKALCGIHEGGRRDSSVLYVSHDVDLSTEWRAHLLASLASVCTEELPPFVSPLTRGIGTASDPGGGVSFGQALCAAVASASAHAGDAARFREAALAAIARLPGMDAHMPALMN